MRSIQRTFDDRPAIGHRGSETPEGRRSRRRIVTFIADYWAEHERSPSLAEIQRGVGLGNTPTLRNIHRLRRDGVITYQGGVARSYRLVDHTPDPRNVADAATTPRPATDQAESPAHAGI